MGYVILQSSDNRAFEVIDGQQRITTLSLLMLAAIARLRELADSDSPDDPENMRAEQLRNSYIGFLDTVTLVSRSKLELGRHNDRFYQHYLVPLEPLPIRGLNASERLLRKAFLWFKAQLGEHIASDGESIASFVDRVVDRLFFTVITVTDELNAFKVFETLNARGVRLSATDLLKNFLFSMVARDVMSGNLANITGAIQALRPVYPEDAEFRAAFSEKALKTRRHRRVVRYILLRLERILSGKEYDFESATFNIEHVLPEHPKQGWDQFDDRDREECTYRLGNLTLLKTSDNRDIENFPYETKRKAYLKSEYVLTQKLAEEFDTWVVSTLSKRQEWMARQATNAWKITFASRR